MLAGFRSNSEKVYYSQWVYYSDTHFCPVLHQNTQIKIKPFLLFSRCSGHMIEFIQALLRINGVLLCDRFL